MTAARNSFLVNIIAVRTAIPTYPYTLWTNFVTKALNKLTADQAKVCAVCQTHDIYNTL